MGMGMGMVLCDQDWDQEFPVLSTYSVKVTLNLYA